jgi:DNA repair exonuclease SbcCD ATPase subunit
VIIALNSTLFEFKDTFIEQINTLPKLQKIIENLKELIQSENLYENLKTELDKLKKDEKLAPIFDKLEEIKIKVEVELEKAGISQTVDEYVEQLKQLKEKLAVQNIKEIILNELSTCDNKFIEQMDKVGEIEGVVNKISEDFEKTEIKNIIISLQQDSQKAAAEIKSGLEKIKPKIIEINAKIQVKIKSYQNDPRFEPLLKIIEPFSEALNKLKEQLEKLDENEQFKALKGKIGSTKEEIVKIEENIKAVQLKDIYYKVKDKIQNFDINGKLVKLNEEKVKFLEERQKYKELETAAQKIEFIFNSGKVISKEDIEEIKKNIEKIKEKLTSLGDERLDAIIDQINKICNGITKNIDKNEIKSKIKEALSKLGEFEGQVKNFDEKKEQEKNQEALTRLKDKANGFNATNILKKIDDMVFESVQAANTTLKLVNRILLDYLNSTDNPTFSGMTKNLTETLEAKIKDLIASAQEAINGTKLEGIVNVISESDEMKELMKKIEELEESVKKYEDKSPEEIKKELIEAFKKSEAGKILQKQADKLEEKLKELRDVVKNKVDLSKLKKIKDKIQDKAEENEKISEYIEKIKSLNKVLKTIIESKAFNKTTNNIKDYIKGIDFKDIITILKEVKNVNVSQEIENAKRIKELTEEINSIYESDPLVNIFKKLNNEKRLLSKVENKKGNKKTKKNLRKLQDKTGEITCKIDKKYNSATSISVEKGTSMQSNILKQTTQFSLSFSSEIKFSIEGDKLNCPAPFVNQVKQNVNFAKHEKFKKEPSNGRIRFRMFFRIRRVRTFVIPRFFYLILRIRIVRHSISTLRKLQNEEEKETYCVPEEDNLSESTSEESPFNCFLYDDNVSDIASLGNITSDYAGNLTDSLSIDEDNGEIGTSSNSGNNNGRKYFRESSGRKLSAGAIVGIVIGSVAVVALILGLTLYLKGKTASAAPIQGDLSDTQKNFQINNSVNVPVNQ